MLTARLWQNPAREDSPSRIEPVKQQRVAVTGGTPTWRRGITSVLEDAGFQTSETEDLSAWKPGRSGSAVILHVASGAELEAISPFHDEHPHIPVLVVAPQLGVAEFAAAVRAGAAAAIGEDEPVQGVIDTLSHVICGKSSAPPTIMQALAMRIPVGFGETLPIDEDATARIRALAAGSTVAQLAADSGYSEREMFRILGDLYARLGVKNRTEAILWASRHGLLDT